LKIGIISLVIPDWKPSFIEKRARLVSDIINEYNDLDLILFSGSTVHKESLNELIISNNIMKSTIILEAEEKQLDRLSKKKWIWTSKWYIFRGNAIIKENIEQLFATSSQAKRKAVEPLLERLEDKRRVNIDGYSCRLVICGENNMLRNKQSEDNRVSFRISDLEDRFQKIFSKTDVFLNPAHTPMGNLAKMRKRWGYLSRGGRLCLFTTNAINEKKLRQRRLQYVFSNSQEQTPETIFRDGSRITVFDWERKE